jgi:hypothetical protein
MSGPAVADAATRDSESFDLQLSLSKGSAVSSAAMDNICDS